ncbi:MAG: acyl carrier protein [Vulcanimicrobiota bacterium]
MLAFCYLVLRVSFLGFGAFGEESTRPFRKHPGVDPLANRVLAVVAERVDLSPSDIPLDQPFDEIGFDSIVSMEIIFNLEEEFDLSIPDQGARDVNTVNDLIELVRGLQTE